MSPPVAARRREAGGLLLESLLSLALGLTVLGVALPLLSWSRAVARDLGRRAAAADGARLAAHRIALDLRRAGFGLGDAPPAITAAGTRLAIRHLEGGFDGGTPVVEPAPPGQAFLAVAALGSMQPGDEVVLRDRLARQHLSRVTYRDAVLRRVGLADPLPFPALPREGARLYRVVRREWRLASDGLRRDGQPALDPPVVMRSAAAASTQLPELLAWLGTLAPDAPPAAGTPDLTLAPVRAGAADGIRAPGPGGARPARSVTLRLMVGARQPQAAAGSPLP